MRGFLDCFFGGLRHEKNQNNFLYIIFNCKHIIRLWKARFAREGLGVLLTLDHLSNTGSESDLAFIPLDPPLENKMYLVWKKYQIFSPIAEKFLEEIRDYIYPL